MHPIQHLVITALLGAAYVAAIWAFSRLGGGLLSGALLVAVGLAVLAFIQNFLWAHSPARVATPAHAQQPLLPDPQSKGMTYFYPGLGGSWMQALRYTGPYGLCGKPGPCAPFPPARVANAPLLLYSLVPIDPPEMVPCNAPALLARPLALPWLPTAIGTYMGTALHRIEQRALYGVDVPLVSFAQRGDTDRFLDVYRASRKEATRRVPILAGTSRGASTVLTAVTLMTPEEQAEIGFVLLEGAFDSVPNIARARFGSVLGYLLVKALPWVTSYDPNYKTPLDFARAFPAHVPVAFVTSEADVVVPMGHTLALRDAVVAARGGNDENVHTLVLKRSSHSFYTNEDCEDQGNYRAFVDKLHETYLL